MLNNPFDDGHRLRRRVPMSARGTVLLGDGSFEPCLIVDVSTGGAQLQLTGSICLPAKFDVAVEGSSRRSAEVIWQDQARVGIRWTKV